MTLHRSMDMFMIIDVKEYFQCCELKYSSVEIYAEPAPCLCYRP